MSGWLTAALCIVSGATLLAALVQVIVHWNAPERSQGLPASPPPIRNGFPVAPKAPPRAVGRVKRYSHRLTLLLSALLLAFGLDPPVPEDQVQGWYPRALRRALMTAGGVCVVALCDVYVYFTTLVLHEALRKGAALDGSQDKKLVSVVYRLFQFQLPLLAVAALVDPLLCGLLDRPAYELIGDSGFAFGGVCLTFGVCAYVWWKLRDRLGALFERVVPAPSSAAQHQYLPATPSPPPPLAYDLPATGGAGAAGRSSGLAPSQQPLFGGGPVAPIGGSVRGSGGGGRGGSVELQPPVAAAGRSQHLALPGQQQHLALTISPTNVAQAAAMHAVPVSGPTPQHAATNSLAPPALASGGTTASPQTSAPLLLNGAAQRAGSATPLALAGVTPLAAGQQHSARGSATGGRGDTGSVASIQVGSVVSGTGGSIHAGAPGTLMPPGGLPPNAILANGVIVQYVDIDVSPLRAEVMTLRNFCLGGFILSVLFVVEFAQSASDRASDSTPYTHFQPWFTSPLVFANLLMCTTACLFATYYAWVPISPEDASDSTVQAYHRGGKQTQGAAAAAMAQQQQRAQMQQQQAAAARGGQPQGQQQARLPYATGQTPSPAAPGMIASPMNGGVVIGAAQGAQGGGPMSQDGTAGGMGGSVPRVGAPPGDSATLRSPANGESPAVTAPPSGVRPAGAGGVDSHSQTGGGAAGGSAVGIGLVVASSGGGSAMRMAGGGGGSAGAGSGVGEARRASDGVDADSAAALVANASTPANQRMPMSGAGGSQGNLSAMGMGMGMSMGVQPAALVIPAGGASILGAAPARGGGDTAMPEPSSVAGGSADEDAFAALRAQLAAAGVQTKAHNNDHHDDMSSVGGDRGMVSRMQAPSGVEASASPQHLRKAHQLAPAAARGAGLLAPPGRSPLHGAALPSASPSGGNIGVDHWDPPTHVLSELAESRTALDTNQAL